MATKLNVLLLGSILLLGIIPISLASALPVDRYLIKSQNPIVIQGYDFDGNFTDFKAITILGENFTYEILREDVGRYEIPLFFKTYGKHNLTIHLFTENKNFTNTLILSNEQLKFPDNLFVYCEKVIINFYDENKDRFIELGIISLIVIFIIITVLVSVDINSRSKKK